MLLLLGAERLGTFGYMVPALDYIFSFLKEKRKGYHFNQT